MKKSDTIKQKIDAINAEYHDTIRRMVYDNPGHTPETHDALWNEFWKACGSEIIDRTKRLEADFARELNREIEVGDGVTMYLWSDSHACTVIARTAKTLTIQRDKAMLSPDFKPEWVPGGFSAICTNSEKQEWTYERDPDGEIIKCRWSEKYGRWQSGSDGSIHIGRGRHEHHDYNF